MAMSTAVSERTSNTQCEACPGAFGLSFGFDQAVAGLLTGYASGAICRIDNLIVPPASQVVTPVSRVLSLNHP